MREFFFESVGDFGAEGENIDKQTFSLLHQRVESVIPVF